MNKTEADQIKLMIDKFVDKPQPNKDNYLIRYLSLKQKDFGMQECILVVTEYYKKEYKKYTEFVMVCEDIMKEYNLRNGWDNSLQDIEL